MQHPSMQHPSLLGEWRSLEARLLTLPSDATMYPENAQQTHLDGMRAISELPDFERRVLDQLALCENITDNSEILRRMLPLKDKFVKGFINLSAALRHECVPLHVRIVEQLIEDARKGVGIFADLRDSEVHAINTLISMGADEDDPGYDYRQELRQETQAIVYVFGDQHLRDDSATFDSAIVERSRERFEEVEDDAIMYINELRQRLSCAIVDDPSATVSETHYELKRALELVIAALPMIYDVDRAYVEDMLGMDVTVDNT